jgi:hypothetical protein
VKLGAGVSALVDTAKEETNRLTKEDIVFFVGEAPMMLLEMLQIKDLLN